MVQGVYTLGEARRRMAHGFRRRKKRPSRGVRSRQWLGRAVRPASRSCSGNVRSGGLFRGTTGMMRDF
jgi:hypothetical protein